PSGQGLPGGPGGMAGRRPDLSLAGTRYSKQTRNAPRRGGPANQGARPPTRRSPFDAAPCPGVPPLAEDRVALVKRIKEANDICDVVSGYLALRPAGGTFKGLCPFHDDSRPSFDVDPRRQRYRCWSCGKYGDVISFVQEQERVDFREALELLARRAGINLDLPQKGN